MNIKDKCELYLKYKYEYYILGNPSISDYEFDLFEKKLKETNHSLALSVTKFVDFPNIDEIKKLNLNINNIVVNSKIKRNEKKYKHLTPMLSIQKLKVEDENNLPYHELELFLSRKNVKSYELSPKMDGNAISLKYEHKNDKFVLTQALTRGDGLQGLDKTNKLKLIVPNELNFDNKDSILQIRGEVVIDRNLWKRKYSDPLKPDNERNFVAGILAKDELVYDEINDLTFVAYDFKIIKDNTVEVVENTMTRLIELGFNKKFKPLIMNINSVKDFDNFYFKYKKYRETCPFRLDGIVIKYPENVRESMSHNGHYPKSFLAVKFLPDVVITKILDYEWTLGKDGHLTPVLILEPVELGGAMVSRASGSNLGKILEKGLYPGSYVELVKFGDIIPGVVRVVEESPQKKEYEEYIKNFIKKHKK